MTDPTPQGPDRPATDGSVMGDHPELEADEDQRDEPVRARDWLSPLVVAGIVGLIVVVVIVLLAAL